MTEEQKKELTALSDLKEQILEGRSVLGDFDGKYLTQLLIRSIKLNEQLNELILNNKQ